MANNKNGKPKKAKKKSQHRDAAEDFDDDGGDGSDYLGQTNGGKSGNFAFPNAASGGSSSMTNPTVCQFCRTPAPRLVGDRWCRACGRALLRCMRASCQSPRLPWDRCCNECGVAFLPGDVVGDPPSSYGSLPLPRVICSFCSAAVANPFDDQRCRNCGKVRIRCPNAACKTLGRFPQDRFCHRCGVNLSDPQGALGTTVNKATGINKSATCVIC